ncbi:MAG: nucleotidyltransferase domain-containing protein [Nitrospirae bacterium]|nr:nucleotidyltransferase domain-containing protein [Nitrospirota bacterium]
MPKDRQRENKWSLSLFSDFSNGIAGKIMRITPIEKTIIKSSVKRHFGGNANVYLFGSRVDDDRKGGDIDLYITTDMPTSEIIREKIGLLVDIEKGLGEQKVDVVINNHTKQKPIYEIAEKYNGPHF